MLWRLFLSVLLITCIAMIFFVFSCGEDGDDNDERNATEDDDCIECATQNDCASKLGSGYICLSGCCLLNVGGDDDSDDDQTNDDDDSNECGTTIRGNLEWTECDNGYDINYYDALDYIDLLDIGGWDDWRLPTINELEGLFDQSRKLQTECDVEVYIVKPFYITCKWAWSSEIIDDYNVWGFNFHYGWEEWGKKHLGHSDRILAVRDI